MLAISSVFVLRLRQPDLPRPYRTWGYPLTPLLYVAASLLLLGNMLADDTSRVQSLAGLGIICSEFRLTGCFIEVQLMSTRRDSVTLVSGGIRHAVVPAIFNRPGRAAHVK